MKALQRLPLALLFLRLGVFIVMLMWTLDKLVKLVVDKKAEPQAEALIATVDRCVRCITRIDGARNGPDRCLQRPLAFRVNEGSREAAPRGDPPSEQRIEVEARQMAGHQKEAVVTLSGRGTAWRLSSDEGVHLKGTDLAPFPLGFFNAGLQSNLCGRLRDHAQCHGVAFQGQSSPIEV